MKEQQLRQFTALENKTWGDLYSALETNRNEMAHPIFKMGIEALEMRGRSIPDLENINRKLQAISGWSGIAVEGLEDGRSFFDGLASKRFPIGNFIRDISDRGYTPAPDIFHDLYGHVPFYVNPSYSNANLEFGKLAQQHYDNPKKLRMLERFFWFTYEFALVETEFGKRIFGGGILSSEAESKFSLSSQPEVREFNVREIANQEFRIDEFQKILFILKSPEQLYDSVNDLDKLLRQVQ